jgi:orc1/cdc6 family replication initiation protein
MPEPLKDPTPLQPDKLPETIQGRTTEKKPIKKLNSENQGSRNIFIHGQRGTGKTHTTKHVLKNIDRKCHVPCTKNDTQYKVLKQILRELDEDVGDGHHTSDLQRMLLEKTEVLQTVIILDDIGFLLLNDGDDILYFLSRMKTSNNVDLVMISSNHTRLKSQVEERTYSSLQPRRVSFEPYTTEDAYQILVERAQKALTDQSLQKAALTYITSTTQDISAGLQWLKHAAKTSQKVITETHAKQVQQKAYQKYTTQLLNPFTEHHKLLYQAIRELETEKNAIETGEIYLKYEKLCDSYNQDTLSKRRLSDFLKHLELLNLIEAEYHYGGSKGKTRDIKLSKL